MTIDKIRKEIDQVDHEIVRDIAHRQELVSEMAKIKISKNVPVHDEKRTREVLEAVFNRAVEYKIDPVQSRKFLKY